MSLHSISFYVHFALRSLFVTYEGYVLLGDRSGTSGYQRYFSSEAGIFGVDRSPKPRKKNFSLFAFF